MNKWMVCCGWCPFVALYAGRPEMLEKVEEVVTATQNSDTSVAVCLNCCKVKVFFL